jgi:proteasome assembly chaperone (PAC2) family protein
MAMDILHIPALRNPVMLCAFAGWNDAAEAASGALEHVLELLGAEDNAVVSTLIAEIDSDEYFDFQVNRPQVSLDEFDNRSITWPSTQIFGVSVPSFPRDLVIVTGVEPSMHWKAFVREVLDLADDLEVSLIIAIGSLLADVPHSRPISVGISTTHPALAKDLGLEISRYEGSTGILGVINDGALRRGIDAISMWAAIPHYASNAPSPKASLALIHTLEDFLEVTIPQGDLPNQADEWEKEIDTLALEDSDVADYVKSLEESKDAQDLPEVSGETIAKEFERYLRRNDQS